MRHMMVDLETLDTTSVSVITSIGAVVFDPSDGQDILGEFYARVEWQEQLSAGRTVSESTIRWWMQQSDDARTAAFTGEAVPLRGALVGLTKLYAAKDCERIWANGPSFDVAILEHAFLHDEMLSAPWKYNAPRDMRTIRDLVPTDFGSDIVMAVAHNALDDAIWQARYVGAALRYLNPALVSIPAPKETTK